MYGGGEAAGDSPGSLTSSMSSAWQRATANMSLPALLDAAFNQQPLLGGGRAASTGNGPQPVGLSSHEIPGRAQPASAAATTVGRFSAAAVVQSLMPSSSGGDGGGAEGSSAGEALQVRRRPLAWCHRGDVIFICHSSWLIWHGQSTPHLMHVARSHGPGKDLGLRAWQRFCAQPPRLCRSLGEWSFSELCLRRTSVTAATAGR